jgi:hypothetical protein
MKGYLVLFAMAGLAQFHASAQGADGEWLRRFRDSFDTALGEQALMLPVERYLDGTEESVLKGLRAGADPEAMGIAAAGDIVEYALDVRGGMTIQDAACRSRQALEVAVDAMSSGRWRIRLARLGSVRRAGERANGKSRASSSCPASGDRYGSEGRGNK